MSLSKSYALKNVFWLQTLKLMKSFISKQISACCCMLDQFKGKVCKGWMQCCAATLKQSHLYFIQARSDPIMDVNEWMWNEPSERRWRKRRRQGLESKLESADNRSRFWNSEVRCNEENLRWLDLWTNVRRLDKLVPVANWFIMAMTTHLRPKADSNVF